MEISSYSRSTQKNTNVHRDTCCDEATGMCRPTCQLCMTIDVNAHMKGNSTRLQRTIATTPLTLDQYRRHKIQFLKTQYVSLESSEVSFLCLLITNLFSVDLYFPPVSIYQCDRKKPSRTESQSNSSSSIVAFTRRRNLVTCGRVNLDKKDL